MRFTVSIGHGVAAVVATVAVLTTATPAAAQLFYDGPYSYQVGVGASLSWRLGSRYDELRDLRRLHGEVRAFADGTVQTLDTPGGDALRPTIGAAMSIRVLGKGETQFEPVLRVGAGQFAVNRSPAHFHVWSGRLEGGLAWRPKHGSVRPLVGIDGRLALARIALRHRPGAWTTLDLGGAVGLSPVSFLERGLDVREAAPDPGDLR